MGEGAHGSGDPRRTPIYPEGPCDSQKAGLAALESAWVAPDGEGSGGYTSPCGGNLGKGEPRPACPDVISASVSSFASAGNARGDPLKSVVEFKALMSLQWPNGFLPHAAFRRRPSAAGNKPLLGSHSSPPSGNITWYGLTPGGKWWWNSTGDSPAHSVTKNGYYTSAIAAPPLQAAAALQIYLYLFHKTPSGNTAYEFLVEAFDGIYNYHSYLFNNRDADKNGLVFIRHPWESPLTWNSSAEAWSALSRAPFPRGMNASSVYFPAEVEKLYGFPDSQSYAKMLAIAECQRDMGWNDIKIGKLTPSSNPGHFTSPCGFLLEDIAFNSLLLRANIDLLSIAEMLSNAKLGADSLGEKIDMINAWIQLSISAIQSNRVKGISYVIGGAKILSTDLSFPNASSKGISDLDSLLPLLAPAHLNESTRQALQVSALSPLFWRRYPLSSSAVLPSS